NDIQVTQILNLAQMAFGPGAGGGTLVRVIDASTQATRLLFYAYDPNVVTGGVRVAMADVNADGIADIITGTGPGPAGECRVFDGRTSGLLMAFFPYGGYTGGIFVGGGDVNADGHADVIVGPDAGMAPNVRAFSGTNGTMLRNFFAYDGGFT